MQTDQEIKDKLKGFITSNLIEDNTAAPGEKDSLIESGLVSSLGLIQLLDFIRRSFGVELEIAKLTPANFDNIDMMAAYIRKAAKAE